MINSTKIFLTLVTLFLVLAFAKRQDSHNHYLRIGPTKDYVEVVHGYEFTSEYLFVLEVYKNDKACLQIKNGKYLHPTDSENIFDYDDECSYKYTIKSKDEDSYTLLDKYGHEHLFRVRPSEVEVPGNMEGELTSARNDVIPTEFPAENNEEQNDYEEESNDLPNLDNENIDVDSEEAFKDEFEEPVTESAEVNNENEDFIESSEVVQDIADLTVAENNLAESNVNEENSEEKPETNVEDMIEATDVSQEDFEEANNEEEDLAAEEEAEAKRKADEEAAALKAAEEEAEAKKKADEEALAKKLEDERKAEEAKAAANKGPKLFDVSQYYNKEFFLKTAHGSFIGIDIFGKVYLGSNHMWWESAHFAPASNGKVYIVFSQFEKRLSARDNGSITGVANSGGWEEWTVEEVDGKVQFKSAWGTYLRADPGNFCNQAKSPNSWERFELKPNINWQA